MLEHARSCRSIRNGCSSSPEPRKRSKWPLELASGSSGIRNLDQDSELNTQWLLKLQMQEGRSKCLLEPACRTVETLSASHSPDLAVAEVRVAAADAAFAGAAVATATAAALHCPGAAAALRTEIESRYRFIKLLISPAPLGLSCGGLEVMVRSTWPLEPARPRWGTRTGLSSLLGFAGALDPTRPRSGARIGRSSVHVASGAFKLVARVYLETARTFEITARTLLETAGALLEPARRCMGHEMAARACLGAAGALEMIARACLGAAVAFKNDARNCDSKTVSLCGCSLNHLARLHFASCMDMHWFARSLSVYIYIYVCIYVYICSCVAN